MTLYHGSNCDFDTVDLSKSRDKRDFGRGFYMTVLPSQANEWAEAMFDRFAGDGVFVYEFELTLSDAMKVKGFEGLSEEWLEMVLKNRTRGGIQHGFDVVEGPVANDQTNRTIALYVEGVYTTEMALQRLRYNKANNQVSIHTEKALSALALIRKGAYER
jgi:hypothetical protein